MGNTKLETLVAQAGSRWDDRTGAVSMPIYQTATFRHAALGASTGFDYSRTSNPTRHVLEETMAALEGGARGAAFASGLAAIDAVLHLFAPESRLIVTEDLYGGTFRLLEKVYGGRGLEVVYTDTSRLEAVEAALKKGVAGIFIESPTNPLLRVADVAAIAERARRAGALTIVDNTFLTARFTRPLELGADLVIYSGTKYLAGHNDVVAGIVVARTAELGERVLFYQNAIGGVLGPQDSWLVLRGLKTLVVRLDRQAASARAVVKYLTRHPRVRRVHFPGLSTHPGYTILSKQSSGFGAMIAFEIDDAGRVPAILAGVKVFLFAESLGGVESLITYPVTQTHADMDPDVRERLGIHAGLLRLSIGLEDVDDLISDLDALL
jgi:cystathionine beta-lyase/cystathionine gamma-synthase